MSIPDSIHDIAPLLSKYLKGELTEEEGARLEQWAAASEANRFFLESLSAEQIIRIENDFDEASIFGKIKEGISRQAVTPLQTGTYRRFYRVAAATVAVVVVLGAIAWLIWKNNGNGKPKNDQQVANAQNNTDIAPGGNRATLTLANGNNIVLDEVQNGTITQQGNTKVSKLDSGLLSYYSEASPGKTLDNTASEILYNKISTPRGGQYQVVLPDGSKVWLNASSSLKFPTAFTGARREVELTGESYFEIVPMLKQGKKIPFIVKTGDIEVEVLGTHFNINAYPDEHEIKTTLLEGSVLVRQAGLTGKEGKSALLKPGEQAGWDKSGGMHVQKDVGVDEIVAWKNGYFQFNDADIESIMRMLSRWYDVDVKYESAEPITQEFIGRIPRNVPVSSVFKILESTGSVRFRVEGKSITVMPARK